MNKTAFLFALALAAGRPAPAQTVRIVTLRDAVAAALARSPDLAGAEASNAESAAGARLARDAFRPFAVVAASPGYANGLPVAVAGQVPAIAGVDLRQTIYDPSLKASALEAEAAQADRAGTLEAARTEAVRSVVALYARCRADRAQAESAIRRVSATEELLRHVESRRSEGRETDLSVERASLALARARQRQLDADSDLDLDERELKAAIGAPPVQEILLPDDPSAVLASPAIDPEAVLENDPVLRSLERQAEILDALRRVQARPVTPVVQAEAQYWRLSNKYAKYYNQFKADDWSVAVAVAVPIFSGGRIAEERLRSESAWKRAEARVRERRQLLEILVARREAVLARATSAASLARRARGVAEEAVREAESVARESRGTPTRRPRSRARSPTPTTSCPGRTGPPPPTGSRPWSVSSGPGAAGTGLTLKSKYM
jgi:outer membrane protein TolC